MQRNRSIDALVAPALGAGTGFIFFVLLCLFLGRPLLPKAGATHLDPMARVVRPMPAGAAAGEAKGVYATVCQTCHQADGKGLPGAFPPLAGSEWATGDPETPIRIVLLGLGGPIEVAGQRFNSLMPPPMGLNDAQIAEAITHVRTSFGNQASEVTKEQVAAVRASLAGRTKSWTAEELTALRGAQAPAPTGAEAPSADGGVPEVPGEAPAVPEGEGVAPTAAPAEEKAP